MVVAFVGATAPAWATVPPGVPADRAATPPPQGSPPPPHVPETPRAAPPPLPTFTPETGRAAGTPIPPLGAQPDALRMRVTGASPFSADCDSAPVSGVAFTGAEVEPYVALDPQNPSHLIGVWQQDRWSDGGARGLLAAYSFDAGATWTWSQAALSRCTGGNAANGGDFARASDPWVAIGPDGIAYQIAIAFTGDTFASGSSSAVLASRSIDGGNTWSPPATVIRDSAAPFNDKESITADPLAPGIAYATWDRLEPSGHGPSWFSRTTNGGETWEPARPIYDPGGRNQTLNNQIVVSAPAGGAITVFDIFTEFDVDPNNAITTHLALVQSTDRGVTWSGPTVISSLRAVGTRDPQNFARELRDGANIAQFASGPSGVLVGVWQDSRFSGGARDGIAFSRSADQGRTWSAPVQINRVPGVAAFLPAISFRSDGAIGVLYDDMRNDTADASTLLVDTWLATSQDGVTWAERHVLGPFDFNLAPVAEGGLFVGDYQGLASGGGEFVAFLAQTNPVPSNRTDIFAATFRSIGPAATPVTSIYRAKAATLRAATADWEERVQQAIARTLRGRLVGAPAPRAPASRPPR